MDGATKKRIAFTVSRFLRQDVVELNCIDGTQFCTEVVVIVVGADTVIVLICVDVEVTVALNKNGLKLPN